MARLWLRLDLPTNSNEGSKGVAGPLGRRLPSWGVLIAHSARVELADLNGTSGAMT